MTKLKDAIYEALGNCFLGDDADVNNGYEITKLNCLLDQLYERIENATAKDVINRTHGDYYTAGLRYILELEE